MALGTEIFLNPHAQVKHTIRPGVKKGVSGGAVVWLEQPQAHTRGGLACALPFGNRIPLNTPMDISEENKLVKESTGV